MNPQIGLTKFAAALLPLKELDRAKCVRCDPDPAGSWKRSPKTPLMCPELSRRRRAVSAAHAEKGFVGRIASAGEDHFLRIRAHRPRSALNAKKYKMASTTHEEIKRTRSALKASKHHTEEMKRTLNALHVSE